MKESLSLRLKEIFRFLNISFFCVYLPSLLVYILNIYMRKLIVNEYEY